MPPGIEPPSERTFRLQIIPLRRSHGVDIVDRAAEISGTQGIRHSTGKRSDYTDLSRNVLYHKILVPSDTRDVQWAQIPDALWNEVQDGLDIPGRGSRTQSALRGSTAARYYSASGPGDQLAREYRAKMPRELDPEQVIDLGKKFTQALAGQYHTPVQLAIHKPQDNKSDYQLYVLLPTQELKNEAFGGTKIWDSANGAATGDKGIARDHRFHERRWSQLTNAALLEAGVERQYSERIAAESRKSAQAAGTNPSQHLVSRAMQTWARFRLSATKPAGAQKSAQHGAGMGNESHGL